MCNKALSALDAANNRQEDSRALITATLLKKRRQDAQQWARELIEFSDKNIHQNRKIPASLRKQLIQKIGITGDNSKL